MGDIIVGALLVLIVVAIIWKMRKDKKNGTSCCGGCTGCGPAATKEMDFCGCGCDEQNKK